MVVVFVASISVLATKCSALKSEQVFVFAAPAVCHQIATRIQIDRA